MGLGVFLFLSVFRIQTLLPPTVQFGYACCWLQTGTWYIYIIFTYILLKSMGLCASVRDLFLQMSRPQWSRHGLQCVRDICTTQGKLAECEPSLKGLRTIWNREERWDGAPAGSYRKHEELSRSCLSLLVTSLNRSVPCVQRQPVYTANTWHTLNPRQLSTALNSKDSSFFQWRLLRRNGLFTQNSQGDVVFPKTLQT